MPAGPCVLKAKALFLGPQTKHHRKGQPNFREILGSPVSASSPRLNRRNHTEEEHHPENSHGLYNSHGNDDKREPFTFPFA